MTDNIIDRDKLQQNLIDQILDDMDLKTLMQLVAEQLDANYGMYTVDELITEVEEYYPQLLKESNTKGGSQKPVGKVAQTPLAKSRKVWDSIRVKGTQLMATPIFSLSPEMQATWDDIMGQMFQFVCDTNADVEMAYDWVCDQLEIDGFVENKKAWYSFMVVYYDAWKCRQPGMTSWGKCFSSFVILMPT
jgi:hypothetical protein